MKLKQILAALLFAVSCSVFGESIAEKDRTCYLFAYFTGNSPAEEQLCYAVSTDGRNFFALNSGKPVIDSKTISESGGIRDPYITRAEDGSFLMVMTDMKSSRGWSSNRAMILMKSKDLINWSHSIVNIQKLYPGQENLKRVWAPQVYFDKTSGKYLIYWSMWYDDGVPDRIFYACANSDFTGLESAPQEFFRGLDGKESIDGDIAFVNGKFHLFYDGKKKAVSDKLVGGEWKADPDFSLTTDFNLEGSSVYKLVNSDTWIFMADGPWTNQFFFAETKDMNHFTPVNVACDFKPRHGSVVTITRSELKGLLAKWGKPEKFELPKQKNPILEGFYADPGVMYSGKTKKYYIYPTHDGFAGWGGKDFPVFSSDDLKEWKYETTILTLGKDVPWANLNAWAPCIMERKQPDGTCKYYFYFCGREKSDTPQMVSVAVADDPLGPFKAVSPVLNFKPEGVRGGQEIDPDVFRDPKSGKYYLYWGNGYMAGAELSDDMLSVKRDTVTVLRPDRSYREGTHVFYRNGIYYFTWSVDDTGSKNYCVRYAMSDSPLGKFTFPENNLVIRRDDSQGIFGTGHHQMICKPGTDEWYIIYHRFAWMNGKVMDGPGYHREVCIDRVYFNEDGTIRQVVPTL